MADCKFKVGDKVAVIQRGVVVAIRPVTRVMARFVELDKGSRWSHHGGPYPSEPYPSRHIAHVTDEMRERVERQRLAGNMKRAVEWENLTTDQLRRVMAIVNEGKGEANHG